MVAGQFKQISQFITGPIINAILIIAALWVGLYSGIAIAVLTPILTFILAPSPIMQLVPQMVLIVILGNLFIVIIPWLLRKKHQLIGIASGAVLKAAFLWCSVSLLIIPFFGGQLKEPQKVMLTAMFSYNQLITAIIGGVIAYLLMLRLNKLFKGRNV